MSGWQRTTDRTLGVILTLTMWFGVAVVAVLGFSVLHEYHHNHVLVYRPTNDTKNVAAAAAKATLRREKPSYRLPAPKGVDAVWLNAETRLVGTLERGRKTMKKRVKTARHKLADALVEE